MRNFLAITVFTALVSLFYTAVAQFLPQLENRPPRTLSWGESLTEEELISAGAEVFEANCVQCHKIGQPGGRCPDLAGIGQRAEGRAQAAGSDGGVDYLLESICQPGDFLAEGFGNIMPAQGRLLSGPQMIAVTAFMQDQGGKVSVSVSDRERGTSWLIDAGCNVGAAGGGAPGAAPVAEQEPLGSPEEIFAQFGCNGCHFVDKPERSVGPSLVGLGNRMDEWKIYESLVAPDAELTPGFPAGLMKATLDSNGFYERMTPQDYKALVDWLASHDEVAQGG